MSFFKHGLRGLRGGWGNDGVDAGLVKAGATFARTGARDVTETARVICVERHAGGVAHVRYSCRLQHASRVLEAGPRTLALPAFIERFGAPRSDPRTYA
jgi:hypothetical protein